ncbi:hypothetical protein e1049d02.tmp1 [Eimeria tenella]|uniref:Uncharacterized protein n=1 Tax=Eimeria tenella TaxID=5802 RepID=C8TDP3_EIMTE|nr:hypothetical protein e1049d02.tmp1 [Eimeria tenella]
MDGGAARRPQSRGSPPAAPAHTAAGKPRLAWMEGRLAGRRAAARRQQPRRTRPRESRALHGWRGGSQAAEPRLAASSPGAHGRGKAAPCMDGGAARRPQSRGSPPAAPAHTAAGKPRLAWMEGRLAGRRAAARRQQPRRTRPRESRALHACRSCGAKQVWGWQFGDSACAAWCAKETLGGADLAPEAGRAGLHACTRKVIYFRNTRRQKRNKKRQK